MGIQEATEEYRAALRMGQKQYKDLVAAGKDPYPAVLDDILPGQANEYQTQTIGVADIPANLVVGTRSAGRTNAFTAGFLPLLAAGSEFSVKWIRLCDAHLSDEGIRDPIECFEYMGKFYVQEGNKRVSVLRYFGAPRITANIRRILPPMSDDPQVKAYYEFMEFYKVSRLYTVQYRNPGDYDRLLAELGKDPGEEWSDREQKLFSAYFQYFVEAFDSLNEKELDIRPEEALLLWLKLYSFRDLGKLTAPELKASLAALWDDVVSAANPESVIVQTSPSPTPKAGIISRLITTTPEHLNVAFLHPRNPALSPWSRAHDEGRQHLEQIFPEEVTVRNYFHADTPELAEALLDQAVEEGADLVFTTTPQLSRVTLKAAVKYPKVRFLNCSVDVPYSSIRTYYCRIYEAKFITGAIAGAIAKNNRIGYVGSSPIFGVPASINAFALGAQLTNPEAKIQLRWSCQPGSPMADFLRDGIRVISNRDAPTPDKSYLEYGNYGTYQLDNDGTLVPLGTPCWLWGKFYENVVRSILSGAWDDSKSGAINYWWGMDSGVIDVELADHLPEGLRSLADILRKGLRSGSIDPFFRRIVAQDGSLKNDGSRCFHPDELLHMDWLCENVEGVIPKFDEILPFAQPVVRELGVYRDQIPAEKEEESL